MVDKARFFKKDRVSARKVPRDRGEIEAYELRFVREAERGTAAYLFTNKAFPKGRAVGKHAVRRFELSSGRLAGSHFKSDEACEKSPAHVHIKVIGRKPICFEDVSETETIGTLTEKIADNLGVDKRNWGFYVAGPKTQREFLPNTTKVREIKFNHDKSLNFLPRTVIR